MSAAIGVVVGAQETAQEWLAPGQNDVGRRAVGSQRRKVDGLRLGETDFLNAFGGRSDPGSNFVVVLDQCRGTMANVRGVSFGSGFPGGSLMVRTTRAGVGDRKVVAHPEPIRPSIINRADCLLFQRF